MKKLILTIIIILASFNAFSQESQEDKSNSALSKFEISTGFGIGGAGLEWKKAPLPGAGKSHGWDHNISNTSSYYWGISYMFSEHVSFGFDFVHSDIGRIDYNDPNHPIPTENIKSMAYGFNVTGHVGSIFKINKRWDIYVSPTVYYLVYDYNYLGSNEKKRDDYFSFGGYMGVKYFITKTVGLDLAFFGSGIPMQSRLGVVVKL